MEGWFLKGALPQIPLTLLNSVLAVCKLTADLFPDREATATSVATTPCRAVTAQGDWRDSISLEVGAVGA
ncbi:hypothetical protein HPP92_018829 [Vanilla planifolia]|uniref:Uncharacterized protein n=1 Tax=Vanilla planifolia TaxID=51239 RepID=A0A835UL42_VANPL|nr:hypothetical protein HPP92_018829 [Vanilla planifolia]